MFLLGPQIQDSYHRGSMSFTETEYTVMCQRDTISAELDLRVFKTNIYIVFTMCQALISMLNMNSLI